MKNKYLQDKDASDKRGFLASINGRTIDLRDDLNRKKACSRLSRVLSNDVLAIFALMQKLLFTATFWSALQEHDLHLKRYE